MADRCSNNLTQSQYDETTWGARKWMPFATQQLSLALLWAWLMRQQEQSGRLRLRRGVPRENKGVHEDGWWTVSECDSACAVP